MIDGVVKHDDYFSKLTTSSLRDTPPSRRRTLAYFKIAPLLEGGEINL